MSADTMICITLAATMATLIYRDTRSTTAPTQEEVFLHDLYVAMFNPKKEIPMRKLVLSLIITLVTLVGLATPSFAQNTPLPTTGDARCDTLLVKQHQLIRDLGWTLDCNTEMSSRYNGGILMGAVVLDGANIVRLWPENIMGDRHVARVAWHEIGHVLNHNWTEAQADAFAWCMEPIQALRHSYDLRPNLKECHEIMASVDLPTNAWTRK